MYITCKPLAGFSPLYTGTVGVAVVTAGPGLTNTVTAVKNAQMAESPVLLMGGAAATLLQVRHSEPVQGGVWAGTSFMRD